MFILILKTCNCIFILNFKACNYIFILIFKGNSSHICKGNTLFKETTTGSAASAKANLIN